jgi:hypothetical protein
MRSVSTPIRFNWIMATDSMDPTPVIQNRWLKHCLQLVVVVSRYAESAVTKIPVRCVKAEETIETLIHKYQVFTIATPLPNLTPTPRANRKRHRSD